MRPSSVALASLIGKRCLQPRLPVNGIRCMSYRAECAPPKEQKDCAKLKIRTSICSEGEVSHPKMLGTIKVPFKSIWEDPFCTSSPCPDPPPKFDSLYYIPTDKFCRKYQQTWNECPPRRIVQKIVCECPKEKMPPFEKRPRKCRPPTARQPTDAGDFMDCRKKQNSRCVKLSMPGCRKAREIPKCSMAKRPSDCKKLKCPYPSFTECQRPAFNKKRPDECSCLVMTSQCEAYLDFLKKRAYKQRFNN